MSYAQSIDGLDTELQTGRVAQDISDNDISLSTTGGDGVTLISPANGEVNVAVTTQFEWDSTTAYGGYKLVFADNQELTNPTEYYITGKTFTVPVDLSASTTYYWKVVGGDVVDNPVEVPADGFTGMTVWDAQTDPAPIYVYDQAAPRTVEAANDLATYIETSSAKTKPTVTSVSDSFSFPSRCIKVGFPETFTEREETLIKCVDGGPIELTGVDEYDASNPNYGRNQPGEEIDSEYMSQAGTYHAVMTFLMDYVGVVWGWIGDIGEAVPTNTELKVATVDSRHTPSCSVRNPFTFSEAGNASNYGISKKWLKRQRGFWSTIVERGHAFTDYYERFHPDAGGNEIELFALQPDGSRGTFPSTPEYVKMEVGEPLLVDKWFDVNVQEELADIPLKDVIKTSFNDASTSGHSVDPRAKALDYNEPDAVQVTLNYATGTQVVPAITDREISFAKSCLTKARETYPNINVSMAAYGPTRPAPKRETPVDGLFISNVANDFSSPDPDSGYGGKTHRQNMDDWLAIWPQNMVWRPNLSNAYGHSRGMWYNHIDVTMTRLKNIIPLGCVGLTPDNFWEHYSTQWPLYYVANQLMYDNSKTIDEILDPAYDTLFGDAATHIKSYYESTQSVIENNLQASTSISQIPTLWNNTRISVLEGHISSALGSVDPASDEYLRVEWVQAGLEWCKDVVRACEYWIEYNSLGIIVDETNVATGGNAVTGDVDSNAGWTARFSSPPTSQSTETNGTSFAFLLNATDGPHYISRLADPVPGDNLDSGTASSGTVNTLTDTSKTWTADEYKDRILKITGGTNSGETRLITSNTTDTITLRNDLSLPIDNTTEYEITTMYVVQADLKHSGTGGSWAFTRINISGEKRAGIDPDETDWKTVQFVAYGGDIIEFRESNDNDDGIVYMDNFSIQQIIPVDQESIATEWNAHNAEAVAKIRVPKWGYDTVNDRWDENDSRPIGESVLKPTGRLPEPGTTDSSAEDPGLI